jgi:hypothetical protein
MQAGLRRLAITALLCALAAAALGIGAAASSAQQATSSPPAVPQLTALDALGALTVKGRAPLTGYSRAAFGPAWFDVDRNGCDTRNDILARDLVRLRMSGDCTVLGGVLAPEPYTGRVNVFIYGQSTVDIDHVVALGDAWQKGAFAWTIARRTVFANDPLNLLAVDYSANRQKGDSDAASWLPSNKAYRCPYVARQLAVKLKYRVWATLAEKEVIQRILRSCPAEPLPR